MKKTVTLAFSEKDISEMIAKAHGLDPKYTKTRIVHTPGDRPFDPDHNEIRVEGVELPPNLVDYSESVSDVTRVEVIDSTGRAYSNWRVKTLESRFQDDGRTLKLFITE